MGSSGLQQGFAFGAAPSQPAPGSAGPAASTSGTAPIPFGSGPPSTFGANTTFAASSTPAFQNTAPIFGSSAPAFGSSAPAFGGAGGQGPAFGASQGFSFGGGQAPAFGGGMFGGGQASSFPAPQQQQQPSNPAMSMGEPTTLIFSAEPSDSLLMPARQWQTFSAWRMIPTKLCPPKPMIAELTSEAPLSLSLSLFLSLPCEHTHFCSWTWHAGHISSFCSRKSLTTRVRSL